ncbi:hypothetical protein RHSP_12871 [Rhizobium freirei PRF 81]|uniref:Uncharacterized protein n=1 Tax=Rhizobium freirei PRF 81 TaxID=363754 RepID=N6UA09_9HYPH|nr:hypothetical protein RHSP_12871 [Rhizobium freirei PRF 81]
MSIHTLIWHPYRPRSANSCQPVECLCFSSLGDGVKGQQLLQKPRHILQIDHVRAIRGRIVRILMGFDEDAGDADGDGRTRQRLDESTIAAGRAALPAGLLHGMGRIEDDRCAHCRHDRQRAHVGDERVIAERGAALAQKNVRIAAVVQLGKHILHVPGCQELPLLDVDDTAGLGGSDQKIGLAREKGRNLQDIDCLGDDGALFFCMNVGQNRKAVLFFQIGEDFHGFFETDATLAGERRAVRLVIGRLIDEADTKLVAEFFQDASYHERMLAAFHLARTGDQGELGGVGKQDFGCALTDDHFGIRAHAISSKANNAPCPGASRAKIRLFLRVYVTPLAAKCDDVTERSRVLKRIARARKPGSWSPTRKS